MTWPETTNHLDEASRLALRARLGVGVVTSSRASATCDSLDVGSVPNSGFDAFEQLLNGTQPERWRVGTMLPDAGAQKSPVGAAPANVAFGRGKA